MGTSLTIEPSSTSACITRYSSMARIASMRLRVTIKSYTFSQEAIVRGYVLCSAIVCIWVLLGQAAFCPASEPEVLSYDITVMLDSSLSRMDVSALLSLRKPDTTSGLAMLLSSDALALSIKAKLRDTWLDVAGEQTSGDSLRLLLPSDLATTDSLTLRFDYRLPVDQFQDVLVLDRGNRWYPLIMDQVTRVRLTAEVPGEYRVFSAGDLIESDTSGHRSRYVWETKIPVFKIPLVIARGSMYQETARTVDAKTIRLYSFTADSGLSETIVSETSDAFDFFTKLMGDYPHASLTLVEIPGLEGTDIASGLVLTGSKDLELVRIGYDDALLLSTAAQWMAAGVFFEFLGRGFWFLQLSLPHHLRLMYIEHAKGNNASTEQLQRGLEAYKQAVESGNDVPILNVDFPNTREKATAIYGKGPFVLEKLRNAMAETDWEKFLQDLYRDYRGRILTYDRFLEYLSKYDRDGTRVKMLKKMLSETGVPE